MQRIECNIKDCNNSMSNFNLKRIIYDLSGIMQLHEF